MARTFLLLLVSAILVTPAVRAGAQSGGDDEGFIGVGARFTWNNYKTPILAYSDAYSDGYRPGHLVDEYGGPNLGGSFQWGLTNQFVLTLALDFAYFSHTVYPFPQPSDFEEKDETVMEVKAHYFTFGVQLGTKIYFWDPVAQEAVLYLDFGIGKYFSVCGNDHKLDDIAQPDAQTILDNEVEMVGKLASPFFFNVAVGAEFFASSSFSVGADILGVRFTYAKGKGGAGTGYHLDEATWSGEQSIIGLYVFSAITMNFNLTAGGSSKPDYSEETGWDQGGALPPPETTPPSETTPPPAGDNWGGAGADGWGTAPIPAPTPAAAPPPPQKRQIKKKAKSSRKSSRKSDSGAQPPPAPEPAPVESTPPPPPPPPGY